MKRSNIERLQAALLVSLLEQMQRRDKKNPRDIATELRSSQQAVEWHEAKNGELLYDIARVTSERDALQRSFDAQRAEAILANKNLRDQILNALGIDDDGGTLLGDYISEMVAKIATFKALQSQVLVALDSEDDGATSLGDYICDLIKRHWEGVVELRHSQQALKWHETECERLVRNLADVRREADSWQAQHSQAAAAHERLVGIAHGYELTIATLEAGLAEATAELDTFNKNCDAHRATTSGIFEQLRSQVLAALNSEDDGTTPIGDYISELIKRYETKVRSSSHPLPHFFLPMLFLCKGCGCRWQLAPGAPRNCPDCGPDGVLVPHPGDEYARRKEIGIKRQLLHLAAKQSSLQEREHHDRS